MPIRYNEQDNRLVYGNVPIKSVMVGDVCVYGDDIGYSTLFIYSEKSDGTISIDGLTEKGKTLSSIWIPSTIKAKNVISISANAFQDCTSLTSIVIPDSVTSIGNYAFWGCSGLTSVYYTGDVAGWCGISFGNAYANPLYYAGNLYIDGSLVKDLVIPDSVTSIGNYAFYNCSGLTSVTIGNGVTSIGNSAFCYCRGLTSITIPDSVTSIGSFAFSGCSGLTSITIPGNGVTSIRSFAFYNCSGLTSVTIGNGVTSIGSEAFYNCSGLTSIVIPNSVTSIGDYAFRDCSKLTSVAFENTSGWQVSSSSDFSSYTELSSSDLANTSTAATYLNSTYNSYYWRRV